MDSNLFFLGITPLDLVDLLLDVWRTTELCSARHLGLDLVIHCFGRMIWFSLPSRPAMFLSSVRSSRRAGLLLVRVDRPPLLPLGRSLVHLLPAWII